MKLTCACGASGEFRDNIAGTIDARKWQERHDANCPLRIVQQQQAERDELRADAERYRHLRKHHYKPRSANTEYDNSMMLSFHVSGVWSDNMDPRVLDGCIDAAMQRGKEQSND